MAEKKGFSMDDAHPWMRKAHEYGCQTRGWTEIRYGTPSYSKWQRFFDGLGYTPSHFAKLSEGGAATMPCKEPEWLPADLQVRDVWKAAA